MTTMNQRSDSNGEGLVLAGGASRRFGRDKALEPSGEGTWAERAATRLAALGLRAVHLSVAQGQPNPAPDWPVIVDESTDREGPLAAIAGALRARDVQLLVLACDYPRMDDPLLAGLLAEAASRPEVDVILAVDGDGRDHPLVAVWRPSALAAMDRCLHAGRRAVRGVLDDLQVVRWACEDRRANRWLDNVNRPAKRDMQRRRRTGDPGGRGMSDDTPTRDARGDAWTHLDEEGRARMVDVGGKPVTARRAVARAGLVLSERAFGAVERQELAKGDPFPVARIAGIQAAKRTSEWIPLCHIVPLDALQVEFALDHDARRVEIRATAEARGSTGVEMEALVAASAAALALYDMTKALDRGARIESVELLEKSGGRSGTWLRE